MSDLASGLSGYDPLGGLVGDSPEIRELVEDANKRVIMNILKSYTGVFDCFSEAIQNALDAVERRTQQESGQYIPKLSIFIDMREKRIRIADNGIGMSIDQIKHCFKPNVSFKKGQKLRGQKGVGATFLAYGYSFVRLQSKQSDSQIAVSLAQGRRWAEDESAQIPRPCFEAVEFDDAFLKEESSGTSIEIYLSGAQGERPRDLSWFGARTAERWLDLLRIKTPLGGVYLTTTDFKPAIHIKVRDPAGEITESHSRNSEYYYPHEITILNNKVKSIKEIRAAERAITGSPEYISQMMKPEFKRLRCIYEVWNHDELLSEGSLLGEEFESEEKFLIERHRVSMYGCFMNSSTVWRRFSKDELGLRENLNLLAAGLHLASDSMVQGEPMVIPLTRSVQYQNNAHIIVHFREGNPDLGRKTFQPELTALAETLAGKAMRAFLRYRSYLEKDTGAEDFPVSSDLFQWKISNLKHLDEHPLARRVARTELAILSVPQQEQDVIALFHELLGVGIIKGLGILASSVNDRYDSLFLADYRASETQNPADLGFSNSNILGVSERHLGQKSDPMVLEYKYDFGSLVRDFRAEEKFSNEIDLVVCWDVNVEDMGNFIFRPLLLSDEGANRRFFGATHKVFVESDSTPVFEIIVLKHLLRFLTDPVNERANQTVLFE